MDRAELERELERLHAACWGWALSCCARDRDLAEEALQTAYLRILSGKAHFDGRSTLRTWVFGIIRRTAMEEWRARVSRRAREPDDVSTVDAIGDPAPGADATAERSEESDAILGALAKLSERQREVIELVFYHGMTIEEAADVMQISLGSARTHYDRGKKALAAELAPAFGHARETDLEVRP